MNRIQTKVGRLHVERHGRGPALLCWPSLFCDGRTMKPLVDDLGRDHQVLLVDGPGHGQSEGVTDSFSIDDCADAGIGLLDALNVRRAIWIGAAWGGHVGTAAAIRHPDRLGALITMNAPMGAWRGRQRALYVSTYWLLKLLGRPRALARKIASAQIAPSRLRERPTVIDPIVDCIVHSQRGAFLAAVRSAMLDRPSLIPRLGAVKVPTLFISGAEDRLFPVDLAREQAAAIPGARFETVPGTAHQSLWEAPELVLPRLRAFISETQGGTGTKSENFHEHRQSQIGQ
jgi:3-oxoadipate enol-lactonase